MSGMKCYLILILAICLTVPMSAKSESDEAAHKYSIDEAHLVLAKRTNGEAWKLIQNEELSEKEQSLLLYTVFASAYHWTFVGTEVHLQRAEWLISKAYSRLGKGRDALIHAKRCLELTTIGGSGFEDFDYAYAHEAMARAHALNGDFQDASYYYKKAKAYANAIVAIENRRLFLSDLKDGNWNGFSE